MTVFGLPAGASALFGSNPIIPTASTSLRITTQPTVTVGTWPLTLSGTGGSITHTKLFTLSVSPLLTATLPDFRITSIQAPPAAGLAMTQTITITVKNQGTANYGPVRLSIPIPLPVPKLVQPTGVRRLQSGFSSPRAYTQTTNYFFWVIPYIDRPSAGVTDVGNCQNQNGQLQQPPFMPFIYSASLPAGGIQTVYASCWLTPGSHTFYARVDVCDNPPDVCSAEYGYVLEKDETNNVRGPVTSGNTLSDQRLFLPLIRR